MTIGTITKTQKCATCGMHVVPGNHVCERARIINAAPGTQSVECGAVFSGSEMCQRFSSFDTGPKEIPSSNSLKKP